ncbi:GNAT family N-acetyltransferase [Xylanimonas protaetiae]|uniref:GNAT family N-acetyltransferase n=1 Tax=Xylanimonas protaetiae TaxID=2509457 RepID=UPI0013EAAD80|nr:GNAT family N-acetyltransferase [Xylanimonas protaetiae]
MTVHIDQADPSEIEACAAIIAAALLDDPVLRTFVRGDHDRLGRLTDLHVALLRNGPAHGGAIDVARADPGGRVVGVAAWEGPDGHAPWWTQVRDVPRTLRAIGLRHAAASLRAQSAFDAARPRTPHWFLADIAVAPAAQGLGAGSALLRHRLGAIDAGPRLPAYLEATTPGSRRLYERWGFRRTDDVVVDGTVATAMTRPAASA